MLIYRGGGGGGRGKGRLHYPRIFHFPRLESIQIKIVNSHSFTFVFCQISGRRERRLNDLPTSHYANMNQRSRGTDLHINYLLDKFKPRWRQFQTF